MSARYGASCPAASHLEGDLTSDHPTPGGGPDLEAKVAAYLAACEEALAAGRMPPPCPPEAEDPELRRRLRRARDCLGLIQQLWPRGDQGSTVSLAATLGADATWFEQVGPDFEFDEPEDEEDEEDDDGTGIGRLGRFRIVCELGRGGFGAVFLAEDPRLGRRVALKVPLIDALTRPGVRKRFLNEAKAAAALDHPNLVPVHEAGAIGPVCYIATAYCDGPTLASWMRDHPRPIRARSAARLVATLAGAIQHVHERGFLHRDLKPSNVLLQPAPGGAGRAVDHCGAADVIEGWIPRITDFGLARVLDGPGEATQSGLPIGSPSYMAPEQAQGRLRDLGPATDVYALGVILYELLVGRTPHEGETPLETLRRVIVEEPSPPRRCRPDLPRDLEAIVLRCLEKDPRRRYARAADLEADLRRFLAGKAISARPATWYERAWKWSRRRPAHAAGLVALALVPALVIAGLTTALAWQQTYNVSLERQKRDIERLLGELLRQRQLNERHLHNSQVALAQQCLDKGHLEDAQDVLDGIGRDPQVPLQPAPAGFEDDYDPRGFAWGLLRRQARREVRQLRGDHGVGVVVPSPDGADLVSSGEGRVLLWDPAEGRIRGQLAGGDLPRAGAAILSPDGRLVAAPMADSTAEGPYRRFALWDARSGRLLARLNPGPAHTGDTLAVTPAFLGAGLLAGVWERDELETLLSVWDLETDPARPCRIVERHGLRGVRFAPAAGRFAVVDADGRLTVHDGRSGATLGTISGPFEPGLTWALSADGLTVAAHVPGRGAVLWDAGSGDEIACLGDLADRACRDLVPDPLGRTFALVEVSGRVHLLGHRGARGPSLMPDEMERTERWVDLAFSPDGARLAVSAYGFPLGRGPIRIIDVADGRMLAEFPGRPEIGSSLAFAPDGASLWIAGGPTIRRWFPGGADAPEPSLAGHGDESWCVAYSPDGTTIASGCDDGVHETITLWDAATGLRRQGWRAHPTGTVAAVAFSPDNGLVATAAFEISDNLTLWDAATGDLITRIVGHTDFVRAVAFHPDGTLLASGGNDAVIRIWGVPGGGHVHELTEPAGVVRALAFSPDGTRLVAVGNDRRLRIWDVATWELICDRPNADDFSAVAFSPVGDLLALADEDDTIHLLDPVDGTVLGSIRDDNELRCLAFSPDGKVLASAGMGGVVHLWDPVTRERVMGLKASDVQINALAFSTDGLTLIAADHHGILHLWRADPTP